MIAPPMEHIWSALQGRRVDLTARRIRKTMVSLVIISDKESHFPETGQNLLVITDVVFTALVRRSSLETYLGYIQMAKSKVSSTLLSWKISPKGLKITNFAAMTASGP